MRKTVRGSKRELKIYAKAQNLPSKWIKKDRDGYYIKLSDRGNKK